MTEANVLKIGKYEILSELGRGAMGVVYKARDPLIDRIVAVKTIRFDMYAQPEQRDEAQKRFLREAKSAGQLSHPHIVTIYEVGEDQGLAFIAMEYIEGRSLEDFLNEKHRFSMEETVRIIIEVAEALDSTHRKNIVHRDIKPGNILMDAEGHPHLVDFGIARIPASTLTQTTAVLGTPFYMAPEQVAARKIDHRVDIFALGAIFYEMLTLEKPFAGDNLTTVVYKIMNEDPPPVRQFTAALPAGLDPIIRKILAKDPDARYPTCRALANDLIRFADESGFDTGLRPQPESSLSETRKLKPVVPPAPAPAAGKPSRKPILIVGLAVVAIAVVAAVFLFVVKPGSQAPAAGPETAANGPADAKADASKPAVKPPAAKPAAAKVEAGKPAANPSAAKPAAGGTGNPPAVTAPNPAVVEALKRADTAWKAGQGEDAMTAVTDALKLEPGNAAALALARTIALADVEPQAKALLDAYLTALKKGKLESFYEKNALPALAARLKANIEVMDKVYDKMEGKAEAIQIDAKAAQYPRFTVKATFPHSITGRTRSNWKNQPVFQGNYTWTLQREAGKWVIADLSFEAR